MDDKPTRRVGRAYATDVARRRAEAEAYLSQHFPRSANLWAQLRSNKMSPSQLAEAIEFMVAEARTIQAPVLEGDRDKLTLNPEQAVALVLQRVGQREISIAQCRAELSALDAVRDAISQVIAAHQDAEKSDSVQMIAAAAQRPSVDREIERRNIDILLAGVGRSNVIRLKQVADKLWKDPHNWTGLPKVIGRFQIRELPASGGIEDELLPPSPNIMRYCKDASAFRTAVTNKAPDVFMDKVEAELDNWITVHYPGNRPRRPEVMAKAWAALIMLEHRAMQASQRRIIVLLPSVWTPGLVMQIKSDN